MAHRGLTQHLVIEAAAAVADRGGLSAVSMRTVAAELDVQAMSLYHHVANKHALLFLLADRAYGAMVVPDDAEPWREGMRRRARALLDDTKRHPWIRDVFGAPDPGPLQLGHWEAMFRYLSVHGFPTAFASSALYAIDSYVLGFATMTRSVPLVGESRHDVDAFVADLAPAIADYPLVAAAVASNIAQPQGSVIEQFDIGLGFIVDGLDRSLAALVAEAARS